MKLLKGGVPVAGESFGTIVSVLQQDLDTLKLTNVDFNQTIALFN